MGTMFMAIDTPCISASPLPRFSLAFIGEENSATCETGLTDPIFFPQQPQRRDVPRELGGKTREDSSAGRLAATRVEENPGEGGINYCPCIRRSLPIVVDSFVSLVLVACLWQPWNPLSFYRASPRFFSSSSSLSSSSAARRWRRCRRGRGGAR